MFSIFFRILYWKKIVDVDFVCLEIRLLWCENVFLVNFMLFVGYWGGNEWKEVNEVLVGNVILWCNIYLFWFCLVECLEFLVVIFL